MKNEFFKLFAAVVLLLVAVACNKDDVITDTKRPPVIKLDSTSGIYSVKVGREILIQPTYEYVEDALYSWTIDGKIVCRESSLRYIADSVGEVYVTLKVYNKYGSAEEELRIDVVDLELPLISLAGSENGYEILVNSELSLTPEVVKTSLETSFSWRVDGIEVSREKDYTFQANEVGVRNFVFTATNEDGTDSVAFDVKVCTQEELPFSWTIEQTEINSSVGRTLRLMPYDITNAFEVTYRWTIDGMDVQNGESPIYLFTPTATGNYVATITASSPYIEPQSATFNIHICAANSTERKPSAASSANWNKVYEFLAAPGQFVNEGYTVTTMEAAVQYAEEQLTNNTYVSLGGFGGYIVVGFDHSIRNTGGYDFSIAGNSFDGSSEPGIVWVMQDENGDGLPNDVWYELRGSETGKPETRQNYAVTYFRPKGIGMSVQWTDNLGRSGCVDYLSAYHHQDYYYPLWVATDRYTLRGTCLKSRNYDTSGNGTYWVNEAFEWGYADNFSSIDRITGNPDNYFRISDAIDFDCKPIDLPYIDFIKVQCGVNAKSGWLGEISTEVFGFKDNSMNH